MNTFGKAVVLALALLPLMADLSFAGTSSCGGDVKFTGGSNSALIKGKVSGYDCCEYRFWARKKQQLTISFADPNANIYAVLYEPVNEILRDQETFVLPQSATYILRVLQPRAMARKGIKKPFSMEFKITD